MSASYINYGPDNYTIAVLTGLTLKGARATGGYELRLELDLMMQANPEVTPGDKAARVPYIFSMQGDLTVSDGARPLTFFQPQWVRHQGPSGKVALQTRPSPVLHALVSGELVCARADR